MFIAFSKRGKVFTKEKNTTGSFTGYRGALCVHSSTVSPPEKANSKSQHIQIPQDAARMHRQRTTSALSEKLSPSPW